MKTLKKYIKPRLQTEEFVPQEYCQVCCGMGLQHKKYIVYTNNDLDTSYTPGDKPVYYHDKGQAKGVITPCFKEDKDLDDIAEDCREYYAQPWDGMGVYGNPIKVLGWFEPEEPGDSEYTPGHTFHIVAANFSGTSKS